MPLTRRTFGSKEPENEPLAAELGAPVVDPGILERWIETGPDPAVLWMNALELRKASSALNVTTHRPKLVVCSSDYGDRYLHLGFVSRRMKGTRLLGKIAYYNAGVDDYFQDLLKFMHLPV